MGFVDLDFDYFVDLSLIDPHGFISWFVEHKSWKTNVGPSILFQKTGTLLDEKDILPDTII